MYQIVSHSRPHDHSHLVALDGFRASLAFWVYLEHLAIYVGTPIRGLIAMGYAVDLFMVLSGFLMVYTWKGSFDDKTFFNQITLAFYVKRFVFGDISYSIYLCHTLIVIPVAYFLVAKTSFLDLPYFHRFTLVVVITFPLVIAFSYLLYR